MRNPGSNVERKTRRISGVITNSGTPTVSKGRGFTISDGGAGVVTITLTSPGRDYLFGTATVINSTAATGHFAKISALSAAGMTVHTFVADATDGAPADVDFCFEILVKDTAV